MESESGRQFRWDDPDQREFNRQLLGIQLRQLGPIKFIEGLRIARQSQERNMTMDEIATKISQKGLANQQSWNEAFIAFGNGYLSDKAEWDEVLGLLER